MPMRCPGKSTPGHRTRAGELSLSRTSGALLFARRALLRRHAPDDADQDHQDCAADGAAGNIADPALDVLPDEGADQLADDAAPDRTRDRIAQHPERVFLESGAGRVAAKRAGNNLNQKTGEIHVPYPLVDPAPISGAACFGHHLETALRVSIAAMRIRHWLVCALRAHFRAGACRYFAE